MSNRRGFSLVEVLIGMAILAIALGSAFTLSYTTARVTQRNQNLAAAASLAEFKLEELRNATYASVASGEDPQLISSLGVAGGIFDRSWVVTDNTPATGLKSIAVTVSWAQWDDTQSYTLDGVIGQ
jgi:prepilin-type N-terminal cleavage/methylation domain-containing protein